MAEAYLVNPQNPLLSVTVASITSTLPACVPTSTRPTSGVLGLQGLIGDYQLQVVPFVQSALATLTARVVGWNLYQSTTGTVWYVPTIIAQVSCTTNQTAISIDGTNDFIGYTTIADAATANPLISLKPDIYTTGTGSAGPASFVARVQGAQLVQVTFAGASAVTAGCYYRTL